MTMKIDINKKYRYRMGDPVRILATDGKGITYKGKPQPVIVLDEQCGEVTFHFEDGTFSDSENDALDLIEVREPREWEIVVSTKENRTHKSGTIDGVATDDLQRGERDIPLSAWEIVRVREIID